MIPLLPLLPMIGSAIGKIFGGASEGKAQEQLNKAKLEQDRNQLINSQYQTQQGAQMNQGQLDLQRKSFDDQTEGSRLRRALIGQLLGNGQALDINIPGIPKAQMSGGLSLGSLGQGGKDTAALMVSRALQQLQQGNQYQGGQVLTPPTVAPVGKQGGSGWLNALSMIGSGLGAMQGMGGGGASSGLSAQNFTPQNPFA